MPESFSSTQTATTTLGSNGTVTGGSSTDSLYETSNDSSTANGSGTKVRQYAFTGAASDSSTFTTTFSSFDSGADTSTETTSDVQSFGTNGAMSSGQNYDTLTSSGTSTDTYSEAGGQTLFWGSGNFDDGSYTNTLTTTESDVPHIRP